MEKKTELLIDVSDIHCGSDVGLAPPSVKTESGNEISFGENIHQAWLWENWCIAQKWLKEIIGNSIAALLVNGDATEGCHHRNESELIAAAIETHTSMAVRCLSPVAKLCKRVFVTKGTACHTLNMENRLAEKLGAVNGKAQNQWLLEINGCLVDAKHHMTTTSRANLEASAMSILMGNAVLNRSRNDHRIPKVFLRAHRHCGGYYSDGTRLFGVTGGWQFLTRHGFKVVPDSIPQPSILVLDWRDKKPGELPQVHEKKFDSPQSEIVSI